MKLGLVLEGGASRAYFSIGIMDFLLEKNIIADLVIGSSAGIANGTSYVSKQIGRNMEIGEKYVCDKRYMGFKHLLNPMNKSFYNIKFVFDEIPNKYVPFDYEAFTNASCETIATVTNIETGNVEYISDTLGEDKTWQPIIASCSLPIMFKPVRLGNSLYMDGGITDPIPIEHAMDCGCDKNIVIITRERSYKKIKETGVNLASFMFRKYPNFVHRLKTRVNSYNIAHQNLIELEKTGNVFVFAPDNTDGWGRTDSDPKKLRFMYDTGYNMAKERYAELLNYLNT